MSKSEHDVENTKHLLTDCAVNDGRYSDHSSDVLTVQRA